MAHIKLDPIESAAEEPVDAPSLLARDHRLLDELFVEFRRAAPQQLDPLARRICKMLRVHAQIEEELFYPLVRRALTSSEPVDQAEREHALAKALIARIESLTSDRPEFTAAVAELAEQVMQHVEQEERVLFAQLRQAGVDLIALGISLAERRDTLLDVLGLHGDDEEGAANQRETHQAASAHRAATADKTGL